MIRRRGVLIGPRDAGRTEGVARRGGAVQLGRRGADPAGDAGSRPGAGLCLARGTRRAARRARACLVGMKSTTAGIASDIHIVKTNRGQDRKEIR